MAFYIRKPGRDDDVIIREIKELLPLLSSNFVNQMKKGPLVAEDLDFMDKKFGDILSEVRINAVPPMEAHPKIVSEDPYVIKYMDQLFKLKLKDNEGLSKKFHAVGDHITPGQVEHKHILETRKAKTGGWSSKLVMHLVIAIMIFSQCSTIMKEVAKHFRSTSIQRGWKKTCLDKLNNAKLAKTVLENQPVRDDNAIAEAEGKIRDYEEEYLIEQRIVNDEIMRCALKMEFDTVLGLSYFIKRPDDLLVRGECKSAIVVLSTYGDDYEAGVLTAYPCGVFSNSMIIPIPPDVIGDNVYYQNVLNYMRSYPDSSVTTSMTKIGKAMSSRRNYGIRAPAKKAVYNRDPVPAESFEGVVVASKILRAGEYEDYLEKLSNNATPSERRAGQAAADYAHYIVQAARDININIGCNELQIISMYVSQKTDVSGLEAKLKLACLGMECVQPEEPNYDWEDPVPLAQPANNQMNSPSSQPPHSPYQSPPSDDEFWIPKEMTSDDDENWDDDQTQNVFMKFLNWISSPFSSNKKNKTRKERRQSTSATSPRASTVFDTPPASPCKKE